MKLIVDQWTRFARQRAHTATHLLHSQLSQIFSDTKQAWSLVDSDLLRFDFCADRLLTDQEIALIQKRINQIIYMSCDVDIQEMKISEATKLWAKAFFEDKYWDLVRVIQIKNTDLPLEMRVDDNQKYFDSLWTNISIELCWWTHVSNTVEIWCFAIIWQETVASGIKRITAITWPRVSEKISELYSTLDMVVSKLWIKTYTQLSDKLDKLINDYDNISQQYQSLESKLINNMLMNIDFRSNNDFEKIIKVSNDYDFKSVVFQSKSLFEGQNVCIYNSDWWFAILTNKTTSAKDLANKFWLKWWWSDFMVQWKDIKVLDL